jgi:hypothetical protein
VDRWLPSCQAHDGITSTRSRAMNLSRIRWAPPSSRYLHLLSPPPGSPLSPSPNLPPALKHISTVTLPAPTQSLHVMRWSSSSPPIGTPTKLLSCIALASTDTIAFTIVSLHKIITHFCAFFLWRPSSIDSIQLNRDAITLLDSRHLSS